MQVGHEFVQPKGLEVVLVRHGETEWSNESRYGSRTEIDLTTAGAGQVDAVGRWLKEHGLLPSEIYSSGLRRSIRSAEVIADTLGLIPASVTVMHDFRELDFGPFEGSSGKELQSKSAFQRWRTLTEIPVVPDGLESFKSAAGRFETGIGKIVDIGKSRESRRVCIVAHGHVMRSWLCTHVIGKINPNLIQLDTGSVSLVRITDHGRRLVFLNLVPHMINVNFTRD